MGNNNFFGQRQLSNRLEDFGYVDMAFATGDNQLISETQNKIELKNDELVAVEGKLNVAKKDVDRETKNLNDSRTYQFGIGKLCKPTYSKSKCVHLRDEHETHVINRIVDKLNGYKATLNTLIAQRNSIQSEIDTLATQLSSLLNAQSQEAGAIMTLAQQGKTPEQIKIQAKADAEAKSRKSKSTKIIILSIVLVAVVLAGFWAFKKIKKKA